MTGVCIGGGAQEGEGCRDAHRASEKYQITSKEMPATDKEACLVVAEVQTSGERVGFFVLFSFSVLFCFVVFSTTLFCFPTQTLCACTEGAPGFLSLRFPT